MPILNYRDFTINDTDHSVARYKERVGKDYFIYEKLLKKAVNWIIEKNVADMEERYCFCSKRYGFGIQIHWRPDRYQQGKFAGYSATTLLDSEYMFFTKKDKKVYVENFKKQGFTEQEAVELSDQGYARLEEHSKEAQQELNSVGYEAFLENGKLYRNFTLVFV